MSLHEDRIEKTLGSVTGDYEGQIPDPQSRIEVLLQKILENGGGSGSGIQSAILDDSQYDIHGIPIVENPVEGLLYLVPNGESGDDTYNEFLYVDGAWEKIGTTYENGYTKSELDFKLPFGVESITVGDTILDNVTLSMHKDGDEDWYISNNISGLTTTKFTKDNYYILEIDGVSKLCCGEYLPSGYPDFVSWHDCTVVGDLGLIGKRCATPEEIAALPEGTVVHGGYYATFDNRFPEFKFDDYCIARRFKNDNNFNLYTSDTSATHTVTLKSATVVFTQVPSYLSGMNGVARYTNIGGKANTSLGNAGLQPSNMDTVHAEGYRTYASGQAAHAEGLENVASGVASHAEGGRNVASGNYSHVEGYSNVVSGGTSHAEGQSNVVSGSQSHSEGCYNVAGGFQNHVEGRNNVTSNMATHASGVLSIASGNASFVIGQACVEDTESTDRTMDLNSGWAAGYKKHVFIVGNGVGDHANGHEQASTRSNAHTLDWHGNAEYAGDVKANACGGGNPVSLVGLDSVVDGMTAATASDEGKALKAKTVSGGKVVEWEFGETVTPDPEVVEGAVSDWLDEHPEATTTVEDGSISYAKFDSQLKANQDAVKAAILACFRKVAWIDENGQDYYDVLESALYPEIIRLRASLNLGSHKIYPTDNIESLRNYLTVTFSEEGNEEPTVITNYTIQGSISAVGDNDLQILYDGYTATITVPVVANTTGLLYDWDFTKSLTDLRQNTTAILKTGEADEVPGKSEGTTPPVRGETGVVFNNAQQVLRLLDSNVDSSALLFGKTIQVDVAEFNWQYNRSTSDIASCRFIAFGDPVGCGGNMQYATGFGFNAPMNSTDYGWRVFLESRVASETSSFTNYDATRMFSGTNAISGHTIGMFITGSGKVKIYMDGTLKGTSNYSLPNDLVGLQIGHGGRPKYGGSFYNARITSVRIYDGDVA